MQTDPTRILLIGQNDTLVNNVKKIIPRAFGVDHCLPLLEELSEKKEEYTPDIAILCLDVDVEMDVEPYAEMSSLGMFDNMAVIVLGQVEECRIFENKVFIKGVHMMQRPVKGSTLAIMLKTCEKELSASRGEHQPLVRRPPVREEEPPKRSYREKRGATGEVPYEDDYRLERGIQSEAPYESDYRRERGIQGEAPYEGDYRREYGIQGEAPYEGDYRREYGMQSEASYEGGRAEQGDESWQGQRPTVESMLEPRLRDDISSYVVVNKKKKAEKRNTTPKLHHDDVLLIPTERGRYFRNIVKEKQIRREIVLPDDELEDMEDGGPKRPTHVSGKFSILVVDDDVQLLGAVRKYLQNDYFVTTVPSGRLAYRFLEVDVVDVILLDYLLRDEDGPTIFKTLRANPKTADIPVIFLTGVSDKERVMNVLSMNPQGYLLKPIEKKELMDAIAKALE